MSIRVNSCYDRRIETQLRQKNNLSKKKRVLQVISPPRQEIQTPFPLAILLKLTLRLRDCLIRLGDYTGFWL